ncbi:Glycosyl hydrolase family 12 [Phytophthora infestans]|uniref:Glycosyl hydrolase family 12 n=1 Tax=Phytophthora infestans TaxID=4787 RepID=A0A833STM2_PHYIN|nr:Glycosyl hydrolase family 12 [Phytophthora infestans]KAF4137530.1 Glycosyl hydrolase family 12 [Phytophthora infestans]
MKLLITIAAATLATPTVFAGTELCGQWNYTETYDFTMYNNLWRAFDDPNGSQCTGLDSVLGSTFAWNMNYNWAGTPYQVKSFPNAALKLNPVQLWNAMSIPVTIEYLFKHSKNTIANVALDLFTKPAIDGEIEYEVMVWPAALGGALHLSTSGKPIKTVSIANIDFTLYQGMNGNMTVLSYILDEIKQTFRSTSRHSSTNFRTATQSTQRST